MSKLLFLVGLVHLAVIALYWSLIKKRKQHPWLQKILWRANRLFTFELYLMIFTDAYVFILIYSLNEAYGDFPSPRNWFSYIISTCVFFTTMMIVLFVPQHWSRPRTRRTVGSRRACSGSSIWI